MSTKPPDLGNAVHTNHHTMHTHTVNQQPALKTQETRKKDYQQTQQNQQSPWLTQQPQPLYPTPIANGYQQQHGRQQNGMLDQNYVPTMINPNKVYPQMKVQTPIMNSSDQWQGMFPHQYVQMYPAQMRTM